MAVTHTGLSDTLPSPPGREEGMVSTVASLWLRHHAQCFYSLALTAVNSPSTKQTVMEVLDVPSIFARTLSDSITDFHPMHIC